MKFPALTQPKNEKLLNLLLLVLLTLGWQHPSIAEFPNGPETGLTQDFNCFRPEEPHRLAAGDRILIRFLEAEDFNGEYLIPIGGSLILPLVGSVSAIGLTAEELADSLIAKYLGFFQEPPLLTVNILAPRPINVLVSGEVSMPGFYKVDLNTGAGSPQPGIKYPTITQAIELAGGTTLAADLSQVQLNRYQSGGENQILNINLWKILQEGNLCRNLTLRDGDTLFVPTASSLNLEEVRQLAATNLAADFNKPRSVIVVGEVNSPGSYVVIGGNTNNVTNLLGIPTVSRALQLAGGIKESADLRRIQLRRQTNTNVQQTIEVNLWKHLTGGDINQDAIVQDGDTIIVPKATEISPTEANLQARANFSPQTIKISLVGEVTRIGIIEVPPNTPLNQALLSVGGVELQRAELDFVELIRLNPNGTVIKERIQLDFEQGINEETNPILRNNDIIIVRRSGLAQFTDTWANIFKPASNLLPLVQILALLRLFN